MEKLFWYFGNWWEELFDSIGGIYMVLFDVILYKYFDVVLLKDFVLRNDGNEFYIEKWNFNVFIFIKE